jgi:hypothetical protein
MGEIIDFNKFKKDLEEWEASEKEKLAQIPPPDTFEIHEEYHFEPAVSSCAYYDKERSPKNMIGNRLFTTGKCEKYLSMEKAGPLFLFSSKLTEGPNELLNEMTVYFGVIYNTTDPKRSHAIEN